MKLGGIMFQQSPEATPEPEQAQPEPVAPAEGEEQLIKNPDVAEVEAYAEDMHRQFMETFGPEQADEWLTEQRPALDSEIREIEAIDRASDLMVITMAKAFMRDTGQARQSGSETPIPVLDSHGIAHLLDTTVASPEYKETGAGGNTGPVAEGALDKFCQILTGQKMSKMRQELVDWRNSPNFEDAPREGVITPHIIEGKDTETVRTNMPNVTFSITPQGAFRFDYMKSVPGGVPTAEQFIDSCRKASGKSRPIDFMEA